MTTIERAPLRGARWAYVCASLGALSLAACADATAVLPPVDEGGGAASPPRGRPPGTGEGAVAPLPANPGDDTAEVGGVRFLLRWRSDGRLVRVLRDGDMSPQDQQTDEPPTDPADRARRFLEGSRAAFGLPESLEGLAVSAIRTSAGITTVALEQRVADRPLFGAGVSVLLDGRGEIVAARSTWVDGARPGADASLGRTEAEHAAGIDPTTTARATLGYTLTSEGTGRPTWRLEGTYGDVFIDARSGEVLRRTTPIFELTGHGDVYRENEWATPMSESVELPGLDGSGYLRGEHVDVTLARGRRVNRGDQAFNFDFRPRDRQFAEVMAYFHVDATARWLGGYGLWARQEPLAVKLGAIAQLNAWYDLRADLISIGAVTGFNVALDGDVVVHETGHAAVFALAPDLLPAGPRTLDGSIHEGYADYLSCALHGNPLSAERFTAELARTGEASHYLGKIGFDPTQPGRRCNAARRWPEDADADPHITGMIVASTLWDLRDAARRKLGSVEGERHAARVAMRALVALPGGTTDLADLGDALLLAERLEGNRVKQGLETALSHHGLSPHTRPRDQPRDVLPFLP